MLTLANGTRTARKTYFCGYCAAPIHRSDQYAYQSNVYDGRAYTWRTCIWCHRDGVGDYAHAWAGFPDEGIDYDTVREWAEEAALTWPRRWGPRDRLFEPISADERRAARAWLARATGDE